MTTQAQGGEQETKELVERFFAYVNSPEGQKRLRRAAAESKALSDKLRRMRHIPWEKLHAPFTI